jgi:MarR family transcriptional regulator, organic hydroperoxide resistance regulator
MTKIEQAFRVETAEDSSGFLLWQVTTLWQRGIKKALDTIDLTHPQFVVLASLLWLSGKQTDVTQIDLSGHSKIDPMTTSGIVRTLEKKRLLERHEHHKDTRAKTVSLTESGIAVTKEAVRIIEAFDQSFFEKLGSEITVFNRMLIQLKTFGQA